MRPKTNYFWIWTFWKRTLYKNYIVDYLRKKSLILQSFYQKKIQIQLSTYRIWRIQKELSVEDKLNNDLQLIDSRIDEIRNVRGELPLEVEDQKMKLQFKHTFWKIESELKLSKILKEKRMQLTSTKGYQKYTKQQETVRNNRDLTL
jgi:hypothetical protein